MRRSIVWLCCAAGVALVGCSSDKKSHAGRVQSAERTLSVTAGLTRVEPVATGSAADDLAETWGADVSGRGTSLGAAYDLTTPAGTAFALRTVAREERAGGVVRISLEHLSVGGQPPASGVSSLSEAGILPRGAGIVSLGNSLETTGDGFARLGLAGRIGEEQLLWVSAHTSLGLETAVIRLRIGAPSAINVEGQEEPAAPHVKTRRTLFSSDSAAFGMPTVAISGDRVSVVTYDGDSDGRFERRLQYDQTADTVTSGGTRETGYDSGNWRDHEVAALGNVLALARSGDSDVTLDLSFDRGATFTQQEILANGAAGQRQRLVQIAVGDDNALAVTFWCTRVDGVSELKLVEGRPSTVDASGSPTAYAFDAPVLLRRETGWVTPVVMGVAYSVGGDLVIGYGFDRETQGGDPQNPTFGRVTSYRCAVRLQGGQFEDTEVDQQVIEGLDPSVSLVGQGTTLSILYAYEASDGVRLRRSVDAGKTFSNPIVIGDGTAHLPNVIAREQGGQLRVDLLYLQQREMGTDLNVRHWAHFDGSATGADYSLITSTSRTLQGGELEVSGVSWLGYDAVRDGDDVVVVCDEATVINEIGLAGPNVGLAAPQGNAAAVQLAAGMTQPAAPPDGAHSHQLQLICLD